KHTPAMSLVSLARAGVRSSAAWAIVVFSRGEADQAACAARASWMARQTRYGVAGMSMWRRPNLERAWADALMTRVREPAQPGSPQALTPSTLVFAGTGWLMTATSGESPARGSA